MLVIAYDGSSHARRAVAAAGALLDGPALVLHVWTPLAEVPPAPTPIPVAGAVHLPAAGGEDDEELERRAKAVAEEGARLAGDAGLTAEGALAQGSGPDGIASRIVDAARERGADLVVVGRRGVSRLQSAVLGSVSHEVVLHSPVPVLVVPPDPREDGEEP